MDVLFCCSNKEFCSLTNIQRHCGENDETEPQIECGNEEGNGNYDIDDGRRYRENNVIEQVGDAVGASVHYTQNLTGFTAQMPSQR